ncbi:MAG: serine hydrolase [Pseudomonadota bacterium]
MAWLVLVTPGQAAPYAAMVMDARSGEVLHSRNAETRLHPASLTKMMTLYIAFEAVRLGEISMDTPVTISRNAANTPYAIGFRAGSRVQLRHLVRAAAVRSSNDAATAIAEAISGSEAAFARRMNRTAVALGMTRTTFRNAHGLTADGHLSTARDMTVMGRRLFYDYPQYYNIFGRVSTPAGPVGTVLNTNRAILNNYRGADGIKTGFTRSAGFNLVSSAERGGVRILATVFGGRSAGSRNARIVELLDMGFDRAPRHAEVRHPSLPVYQNMPEGLMGGRVVRVSGAVRRSLIPTPRPAPEADMDDVLIAAIEGAVGDALSEALAPSALGSAQEDLEATPVPRPLRPGATDAAVASALSPEMEETTEEASEITIASAPNDDAAPDGQSPGVSLTEDGVVILSAEAVSAARPRPRPIDVNDVVARAQPLAPEIVTRSSSSGQRLFGVSLGQFATENDAERMLLQTALAELDTFDTALRHVANRSTGFEAQFAGMTATEAEQACTRLSARNLPCETFGPS